MTGPDTTPTPNPTDPSAGGTQTIDGKYEVLRELPAQGNVQLYEVKAAEGVTRRVAWFDVGTPADRQQFHAYRTALRAIAPAGLTDVVARPGAYYAVWQDVAGTPLTDFLAQPNKRQETVEAVEALAAQLAQHGFALADSDVVMDGQTPRVAYLRPASSRTPGEIETLNSATLSALQNGRIRKKKVRRPREPGAWLAFVPGVLLLGGAGWLGAQAAQIYLNPPVGEVKSVTGRPATDAATALVKAGFRVDYNYGDSGGVPVGAVIRQDPAAGTTLPIGRLVLLTVNKPQPLTVPKLEDMTLEEARGPLKDNILSLGKVVKADGTLSNTPEGRIIAQSPAPGATTQRGQPVQVVVSTGVKGENTWLADLRGLTYDQAREHVRDAGLVVTNVIKEPSDRTENTVLRQDPAPFVRVTVGSPVKLVIATAKFTPPSTPAGSLPVPPPYVPPPPPVDPGLGTDTTTGSSPTDNTTPPPVTTPAEPTPGNQPPVQQPQEIPPTGENTGTSGNSAHEVQFAYLFPEGLPAGTYSVVVQDADGERVLMPPTDSTRLAGQQATAPATVRGNPVFVIRVNGAEYARVNPQ